LATSPSGNGHARSGRDFPRQRPLRSECLGGSWPVGASSG
jgi:hypothetical protein